MTSGITHYKYWVTSDGRRFEVQREAQDWERLHTLRKWFRETIPTLSPDEAAELARLLDAGFSCLPRKKPNAKR